jgi:dipeptidase E
MKVVYPEEVFEELIEPLAYVDCLFIPHFNSKYFTQVRKEVLEKHKANFNFPLYACDDDSALKIIDGNIEVVSEGECVILNK